MSFRAKAQGRRLGTLIPAADSPKIVRRFFAT